MEKKTKLKITATTWIQAKMIYPPNLVNIEACSILRPYLYPDIVYKYRNWLPKQSEYFLT